MSDQPEARAIVTGAAAPSAAALDQFKAEMERKGIDPSATLKAYGVAPTPALPNATPAAAPPTPAAEQIEVLNPATKVAKYSSGQADGAYVQWMNRFMPVAPYGASETELETWRALGQLPPEGADAVTIEATRKAWEGKITGAFNADGYVEDETPAPKPGSAGAYDASPLGAGQAGEYRLNFTQYIGRGVDDAPTANTEFQAAFAAAGVPRGFAQAMLDDILGGAQTFANMKPEAQGHYKGEQRTILNKMTGGKADLAVMYAAEVVAKMPKAFRDKLYANGAGHSATVIARLAQTYELQQKRASM